MRSDVNSPEQFAGSVMARLSSQGIVARASVPGDVAKGGHEHAFGHPDFLLDLPVGRIEFRRGAVAFIDLRQFTARTFWDPHDEVVRISAAVLTEIAESVVRHGGYVLGLRGDGLFAFFEAPNDPAASPLESGLAVTAAAFALDAVRSALNPLLEADGYRPVQVRAGLDHGQIGFTRIAAAGRSEVNPQGFAANFAARCEKTALAWEVVAGEGLAKHLDRADLTTHPDSPARYQRDRDQRSYGYYFVRWERYLQFAGGVAADLAGRPSRAVRVH
jgi:class 3 adenylate cyclase